MKPESSAQKNNKTLTSIVIAALVVPFFVILYREYQTYSTFELNCGFFNFVVSRYNNPAFIVIDAALTLLLIFCIWLNINFYKRIKSSGIVAEMSSIANVPILILEADKTIYWSNLDKVEFFHGVNIEESVNALLSGNDARDKFAECLETGETQSYETEAKLLDKNYWLHISIAKIKYPSLKKLICVSISDISNLKEASERIENQQRELKMQNEMLTLITAQMEVQQAGIKEQNEILADQHKQLEHQAADLKNALDELEIRNKQITTKTNYITDSIKYAQTIQEAMLPDQQQMENFFDNFVVYRPKDIVSGDFYWLSVMENYTFVVLGDCTGHGVPGAFMSMIGIRILGELINELKIDRPSIILETMHEKIQAALKQDITENNDGMDIAICRFKFVEDGENRKWELKYAGAKQPAYLKRKNSDETEIIEANRRGIGGQSYADIFFFEDKDYTLNIGDRIYLTSDGIKDQNNVMRKRFGTNRLKMMFSLTSTEKIQDQKIAVETLINNWQGLEEQRDDISLWGIELGDHALVPQM